MGSILRKLTVLALLLGITNAYAQSKNGGWEKIGQKQVDFKVEKDILKVTSAKGNFTKVKLKVRGASVNFYDMKIYFGNGQMQDVSLRSVIPAGGESRVIDLDGNDRVINRIEFVYDTKNNPEKSPKATVVVWAKD
ncbi:MAG: DUF2541 family protein [Thermonemataceae bacterium]|nr:DUF2541 family protein [Thermonemataceae bacterium]